MTYLIAIEGIDGSGKGTQAQRLYDRFSASGKSAAILSFPRYSETLFGKAIGDYLNGRFGTLQEVSPFLAALLYAGDRFESRDFLLETLKDNEVVILDRYTASNLAHQGSKLDGAERREIVDWIRRIEYEIYQLPRPDLVVLLDLPVLEAQKLIATKQARSYTDKAFDLQEADTAYLEGVRNVYLELAEEEPNWCKIDCWRSNAMRSIEEIGEEIWNVVNSRRNA
ncbi:MAG: dTMP kinase [Planctomycetes bacterium]|nr:dTMP kinase [Planctomycetota bacterium]